MYKSVILQVSEDLTDPHSEDDRQVWVLGIFHDCEDGKAVVEIPGATLLHGVPSKN